MTNVENELKELERLNIDYDNLENKLLSFLQEKIKKINSL